MHFILEKEQLHTSAKNKPPTLTFHPLNSLDFELILEPQRLEFLATFFSHLMP